MLPLLSISATNEFSYEKNTLSNQFSKVDQISAFIDENDVSYSELSENPLFKGELNLTNHIAVSPNSVFDDMDWKAFAWGALCCPVGAFLYYLPSRDKEDNEKKSFAKGVVTTFVIVLIAGIPLGFTTVTVN